MLALILGFVLSVVGALAPGIGDAPGLADLPTLPAAAEDHSQVADALQNAGRPEALPANGGAGEEAANGLEDAPPVDVSNAPESIDLSGVPAADQANVPDEVGAADQAELPDQAGGVGPPSDVPAGPPSDVPAGPPSDIPPDQAADTAACAADARGPGAAGCQGG